MHLNRAGTAHQRQVWQSARRAWSVRGRSLPYRSLIGATLWLVAASVQGQPNNTLPTQVQSADVPGITSQAKLLSQLSGALETIVARVSPAVVQIQASGLGPLEDKDGVALIVRQHGIGSGVIVDPDGYIVTNAHVVEGAQRIRVVLPIPPAESLLEIPPLGKQQVLEAKLIGTSKETDLAVLKVEGHDFPTASLNPKRPVRPGELVVAIGSPEGLQSSITMGVVSSVWRQPHPDLPMVYIQTDASINPGNSGGPLVDLDGNIVGINTFIMSQGGGSEGLGFAIPATVVGFVYQDLRKYGHVHRIELQVHAQTITPVLAAGLGLAQKWGVVISDVAAEGSGDVAGLRTKDIVLSVDGHPILSMPGLMASLYMHPRDEKVRLEILRNSQTITLEVPVQEHYDVMDQLANLIDPANCIELLGVFVTDLSDLPRIALAGLGMPEGVIVVGQLPDPTVLRADIRMGDIIRAVNRTSIQSVKQLKWVMRSIKRDDPLVLEVERQGVLRFVSFENE